MKKVDYILQLYLLYSCFSGSFLSAATDDHQYGNSLNNEDLLNEEIFDELNNNKNKESYVKELTDDTFEHLTQAASGATTGDWFVMFYSDDCIKCQKLNEKWETVGAKLKQRINVAKVSKQTSTARRFNVFDVPEFILFHHGKMYRYQIQKYDVNSFVSFASDWYKNAQAERVPAPQTPFDDLVLAIVNFLRENPWIMKLGSIIIGVVVIVSVASKLRLKTDISHLQDKTK